MPFSLYANVQVPIIREYQKNRAVDHETVNHRIFIASYATLLLAQWWAINTKRVKVFAPSGTYYFPEHRICSFEVVDEPAPDPGLVGLPDPPFPP